MTLTPWFLAQAYFSSILVFTGLYTLYIRISVSFLCVMLVKICALSIRVTRIYPGHTLNCGYSRQYFFRNSIPIAYQQQSEQPYRQQSEQHTNSNQNSIPIACQQQSEQHTNSIPIIAIRIAYQQHQTKRISRIFLDGSYRQLFFENYSNLDNFEHLIYYHYQSCFISFSY